MATLNLKINVRYQKQDEKAHVKVGGKEDVQHI